MKNYAQFIQLYSRQKKEKEIFTEEEIEKIEKDGSEASRIILMLLSTGMRIGELFSLRLEDYHETYLIGGSKTEAGRNRVIPIRPEGRAHFKYFAELATGPLFLSGYVGQKTYANYRNRDYYPLLNKLGIAKKGRGFLTPVDKYSTFIFSHFQLFFRWRNNRRRLRTETVTNKSLTLSRTLFFSLLLHIHGD